MSPLGIVASERISKVDDKAVCEWEVAAAIAGRVLETYPSNLDAVRKNIQFRFQLSLRIVQSIGDEIARFAIVEVCDRVPLRMSRRKLKVVVRAPTCVSLARSLFWEIEGYPIIFGL